MPDYRIGTTKTLFFESVITASTEQEALASFRWEHDFRDDFANVIGWSNDVILEVTPSESDADLEPVDNSVDNFPESIP